ncbi:MAG: hypothetical protein IT210_02025 [Armatimonadetes bacterium]|nr:hypothetical protein [Armatimonadota bacterium]
MKKILFAIWMMVSLSAVWGQDRKILPPRPDPIQAWLRAVEVEAPRTHGNLTLFPIVLREGIAHRPYLTMDESLDRGLLVLTEQGGGQVNQVVVQNRSDRYVFLMSGEVISGGKQDRMISEDTLLPPRSPRIAIGVYCVEHGRWVAQSSQFASKRMAVAGSIRGQARLHRSQQQVWDSIDRKQESLGVPAAPTRAFAKLYDAERVQAESKPYLDEFDDLPARYPEAVGVVVGVGRRILTADLFANPSLFRKLWPKLLKSYVLDAMGEPSMGRLSREEAERFLRLAGRASRTYTESPGSGDLVRLRSQQGSGSALLDRQAVVHLDFFPGIAALEEKNEGQTPILRFRRDRRLGIPQQRR